MSNNKFIVENSENLDEKIDAINYLIQESDLDQSLIHFLVHGLNSSNRGLKDACYRALVNYPAHLKDFVASAVAPIIETREIELRNLAGDILTKLKKHSSGALVNYLKSDDFDIRKFACDIIGLVDDGENIDTIMQLYDDSDDNVVLSSIEAIGNIFYRNQTNVDKQHIVKSLIELYEINNENLQPQIIETLGKIGGSDSESFLLNIVRHDTDLFLKIAAIDSLAVVGSDIGICNLLLSEINEYPIEIQTVVLKTALAIGFRIEEIPELPDNSRNIAHKALLDDDPDISSAGLAALGQQFKTEDVRFIIKFYEKAEFETQQYILYNLLENSSNGVKQDFVVTFFDCNIDDDSASNNTDFVSAIQTIWESLSNYNQEFVLKMIIELMIEKNCINKNEVIEILSKFDDELLEKVRTLIISDNTEISKSLDELFQKIYYFK